jgi:hypothetical protein
MAKSSTTARQATDLHRPALPILLYDLGAASQLLPSAAILPEQFYSLPAGGEAQGGEVALRRAILEDAVGCFQKQFVRKGRRVQRLAREAEEWFAADDMGWPFSFVNTCAVLGLDPDYIRLGLKRWRERYRDEAVEHKPCTVASARPLRFAA